MKFSSETDIFTCIQTHERGNANQHILGKEFPCQLQNGLEKGVLYLLTLITSNKNGQKSNRNVAPMIGIISAYTTIKGVLVR